MSKPTNDQQHIIDALKRKDYLYVWEQVKGIGYKKVKNINDRFVIFNDIVDKFDYENNNNFIQFYITRLNYHNIDSQPTFRVSKNRRVNNTLISEHISKTECKHSKTARILSNWHN